MKGITYLTKYFWQNNKGYIFFTVMNQLLVSTIPLLTIIFPKFLIDELVGPQRVDHLILYASLSVGLLFTCSIIANWCKKKSFKKKSELFISFQLELTENLAKADYQNIESMEFLNQKEKASKILYGNGNGFGTVFENCVAIIGCCFTFAGILGILLTLNVPLVLFFVFLSLVSGYFIQKSKKRYAQFDLEKVPVERKTNYFINLIESFQYGKEIRIYGISDWLTKKIAQQLNLSNSFYGKQLAELTKMENINALIALIRDGFTYFFLIREVLNNRISIGDFAMYIAAIASFSGALKIIVDSIADIRQFEGYFDALEAYLNIPRKIRNSGHLPISAGPYTIEFQNVTFSYPGQTRPSLKNVSFKLAPGETLAIVGENGAGKTTLVKLICRLYQPTSGTILLNNIDISQYDYEAYIALISTVFQDFRLFSFDIKENVSFDHEVKDTEIAKILKRNGLENKLTQLDKGIHTYIYKDFDEQGFEPSGGEAQKIALARADFKDAPIIILDEPTSAMDPRSEHELYKRFGEIIQDKSAIFITHRLASTQFCDKILLLKAGTICEFGSHPELLKQKGEYFELYHMQSDYYANDTTETNEETIPDFQSAAPSLVK